VTDPGQTPNPAEAADAIAQVLRAIHAGDLTAPSGATARLEGAYIALRSLADGRAPSPEDLLGDPHLQATDD
jgi:hypothetical protein